MQEPFLIGERVYLRPLERADASMLVPWLSDPQVTQPLGEIFIPADIQAEADLIDRLYQEGHDLLLGIVLPDTDRTDRAGRIDRMDRIDRLIGVTEIHHLDLHNRQASFGIVIGDIQEWGKGYGAEVTALLCEYLLSGLGLNRVWLHVDEHNTRGIRAYEKVGFQPEGLLRQDRYQDGRYYNTVLMALLCEEWEAAKSGGL